MRCRPTSSDCSARMRLHSQHGVERQRPLPDMAQLVEQCLTPRERTALDGLAEDERRLALWRCWTQKEALAKALGLGLSILQSIEVSAHPARPASVLSLSEPSHNGQAWRCHELSIAGTSQFWWPRGEASDG